MKILLTGSSGTVGTAMLDLATARGDQVTLWDRGQVPINDYAAMEAFVHEVAPDVLFHLAIASKPTGIENESWLVNFEWPSELAWICKQQSIKFVFTSSTLVFSDDAKGPFTLKSVPDAESGYGFEKRSAELKVMAQNPESIVVRLGWQIGEESGSNNMIDFFEKQMAEHGHIAASDEWLPACSFLPDTAAALFRLAEEEPGIYQLDSNDKWTFFQIACALNERHGGSWIIRPNSDFVYDQRLIDDRVQVPPLGERLPELLSY